MIKKDEKLIPYNVSFIGATFRDVNVPNEDFTNKRVMLVKTSLKKNGASVLPKASADYVGVSFFYTGTSEYIIPIDGADADKIKFNKNNLYQCVEKETGVYTWAETKLGGDIWKGVVDSSNDLPNSADYKVGEQFRVVEDGNYSTDYTDTSKVVKTYAVKGDFFVLVQEKDEVANTQCKYIKISSGDDKYVTELPVSSIVLNDDGYYETTITNTLGTTDVHVVGMLEDVASATDTTRIRQDLGTMLTEIKPASYDVDGTNEIVVRFCVDLSKKCVDASTAKVILMVFAGING